MHHFVWLGLALATMTPPRQAAAGCQGAGEWSDVTGFQEAVISVSNLAAAVATWREVGGFEEPCKGPAAKGLAAFWGLPVETRIDEVVLLKPGQARGLVRLVRIHGVQQVQIRSSGMPWDTGGLFDLYVYVEDVGPVFRALRERGWQAYNDPVGYTLGGFDVREVLMRGPDGEVLALIQRNAPPFDKSGFGLDAGFGWPFNSVLLVRDFAAHERFFEHRLGWKRHLKGVSRSQPPGDNPAGLPRNLALTAGRRFAVFAPHEEDRNGSLQILQTEGLEGRDFSQAAEPPNLGILAVRVQVPDLEAFEAGFRKRGGEVARAPRRLKLAPFGVVEILAIKAPNGARLEVFSCE